MPWCFCFFNRWLLSDLIETAKTDGLWECAEEICRWTATLSGVHRRFFISQWESEGRGLSCQLAVVQFGCTYHDGVTVRTRIGCSSAPQKWIQEATTPRGENISAHRRQKKKKKRQSDWSHQDILLVLFCCCSFLFLLWFFFCLVFEWYPSLHWRHHPNPAAAFTPVQSVWQTCETRHVSLGDDRLVA